MYVPCLHNHCQLTSSLSMFVTLWYITSPLSPLINLLYVQSIYKYIERESSQTCIQQSPSRQRKNDCIRHKLWMMIDHVSDINALLS